MNKKFDKILLGMLWLIASTLGVCFWFNTKFGFDIFSRSHWQHLAYMQASQQPIQTSFYISLIVSVFIMIIVLHNLIRPRFRKIKFKQNQPQSSMIYVQKTSETKQQPQQQMAVNKPAQIQPSSGPMTRPPRLNIPQNTMRPPQNTAHIVAPPMQPARQQNPQSMQPIINDLKRIFTSTGYTVTKNPTAPNTPISLVAIGSGEKLWIGGVGISVQQMQKTINKLQQIFSDTLDEIIIDLSGFIVSPNRSDNTPAGNILMFNTVQELYQYMSTHKNPTTDTDPESIRAFETYINTVMDYIGKI
jgi:hypothetical protein